MEPSRIRIAFCAVAVALFSMSAALAVERMEPRKRPNGLVGHPERLGHHYIQTDPNNNIVPWPGDNLGQSYDLILQLIWHKWDIIPYVHDGVKYYMLHRILPYTLDNPVFKTHHHDDGIGGDQIQMLLASWTKYYAYTGDKKVLDNMVYMADFYLARGLSGPECKWPNLPYPWHSKSDPGFRYDGDLRNGLNVTQLDKAGDLGCQLINLYKMTDNKRYLDAAVRIADTLARNTVPGDINNSPLPYKVNTETGESLWPYTANWTWTVIMFDELIRLNTRDTASYTKARDTFVDWLKTVPMSEDKYGPFFEDISIWSNTGINAGRLAWYILTHKEQWGDAWRKDARHCLDWMYNELGNHRWDKYGVTVINEQSVYQYEGNSHTCRYASIELLYARLTGDETRVANAVRQLNWATYSVDTEGRNEYPGDPYDTEIWFTDGYGDYVEHYLNAMAAMPEKLAPDNANHLVHSTSIVKTIEYSPEKITYTTYDNAATETLRLTSKPTAVGLADKNLPQLNEDAGQGWLWKPMDKGGILTIRHTSANTCEVLLK
jgi:hypothetical protein